MSTNARKAAWQWLHREIKRRASGGVDDDSSIGLVWREIVDADAELDFVFELAGFGATFALMPRTNNDPLAVADEIGKAIMAEPDGQCDECGKPCDESDDYCQDCESTQ